MIWNACCRQRRRNRYDCLDVCAHVPAFCFDCASGYFTWACISDYSSRSGNARQELVVQRFFSGLNSFTLLAIPFFILAGALMESAGISQRIVDFVATMVGHYHGGLATILIISCMFFGA